MIGELRAFAEVTDDGGFRDRLGHLDVQGVLPLRVLDVVAPGAGPEPRYSSSRCAGSGAWVLGLGCLG